MKILESNMRNEHEDVEYLYVFHDLATHKVANELHYAISKTNYFMSKESFYKQHEMLQEGVDGKDFKDQASVMNHIAILNKSQLKSAESKRKELQNILASAPDSDRISTVINFHDEVIGLILEWFNIHDEILTEDVSDKELTNNALWAIADDMRDQKERGYFETYREAYKWAEENMYKKGVTITAKKLEKAYHKAKSEGIVE